MQEIKREVLVNKASELLKNGTVDRVFGWKKGEFDYDITPALFTSAEDIEKEFVWGDFCGANFSKYLVKETGKSENKVLVFAKGAKVKEAEDAGADFVGSDEIVQKIQGGWLGFDVAIATPDMMGTVGRLGKVLGPRGLMPNPKLGTVTMDVTKAVSEAKAGKVEYRTDKAGNVHVPIGKASFDSEKLEQNFRTLVDTLVRVRPAAAKGQYICSITLSATMGPGVPVALNA